MIGCDLSACTMIHEVEWEAQVPYLDIHYKKEWGRKALFYNQEGELQEYKFKRIPGCSHGFVKAEPLLIKAGCLQKISINHEQSRLIDANCLLNLLVPYLKKYPYFFVDRNRTDCYHCREVIRRLNKPSRI